MAFYEHTFIGKQDLSDKEVDNLIDKYSKVIGKSGKILKTEKWGLLSLANKIKKIEKGSLCTLSQKLKVKLLKRQKNNCPSITMLLDI